jgi:hypothetical protein
MGAETGPNAPEGHTGPSGANEPIVWVDCEDSLRFGLDPESLDAWKARQLEQAPVRSSEHWEALARAAGVSAKQAEPS